MRVFPFENGVFDYWRVFPVLLFYVVPSAASLSSGMLIVAACLIGSVFAGGAFLLLSTFILNHRDLA